MNIPKTPDTIRDNYLTTYKNALVEQAGIENPNVLPGSDAWIDASALANELYAVFSAATAYADAMMPDTADGDDLVRILGFFGLSPRSAVGAVGSVTLLSNNPSAIAQGAVLVGPSGQQYQVSIGGTYANGSAVPVVATSTGAVTNQPAGVVLRWQTPPSYAAHTAVVGVAGLVGGADAEDLEAARARLFQFLQARPMSGNWSHVAALCENSSVAVQKAFVYPAVEGGTTVHLAALGPVSATSKSRVIDSAVLTTVITPYVVQQLPEGVLCTVTGTADVSEDVSFAISIPDVTAGNGWVNAVTWPQPDTGDEFNLVGTVTNGAIFVISCPTAPFAFSTRIAFYDYTACKLQTALIIAVTTIANDHTVTIDTTWANIVAGDWVFPMCRNASAYVASVLETFAFMGPGEKTSSRALLPRSLRHPFVRAQYPSSVGPNMLRAISMAGDEVLDVGFLYRLSAGAPPALPSPVTSPPKVYIPRRIAFYPV